MTDQNDYKAALEDWTKADKKWLNFETIRRALLIADKLQQEPSEEMINAWFGSDKREPPWNGPFSAMVSQLLKEVDQELFSINNVLTNADCL